MGLSRQVALGVAILIWLLVMMLLSPLISILLSPVLELYALYADYLPHGLGTVFTIILLLLVYIEARWLGVWLRLPLPQVLLWVLIAELILQPVRGWLIGWPDYVLLSASPYWLEEYAQSGFTAGRLVLSVPWLWLLAGALAVAIKAPCYYLALVRGKAGRALWPAIAVPAAAYAFLVVLNLFMLVWI